MRESQITTEARKKAEELRQEWKRVKPRGKIKRGYEVDQVAVDALEELTFIFRLNKSRTLEALIYRAASEAGLDLPQRPDPFADSPDAAD